MFVCSLLMATVAGASAQTFTIIFNFPLSANEPPGPLTMEAAGNLSGSLFLA